MNPPDDDERQRQERVPYETAADRAETWQSITEDACIHPDDWEAVYEAYRRGEPGWQYATCHGQEYEARQQATERNRGGSSCQVLVARDPRDRVAVGWDRELETFFGQVWEERKEFGEKYYHLTLWRGRDRQEVRTVEELAACLEQVAEIPEATIAELREPQRVSPLRTRTVAAPEEGLDDWLRVEPRRPDHAAPRQETREVHEQELRPFQGHHPKLTREL